MTDEEAAWFAAQVAVTDARRALNAALGTVRKFQKRARDIVVKGRTISGRPEKWSMPVAEGARLAHRKKWGWVVEVRVTTDNGEGHVWVDQKPIIFPARWLSMPEDAWEAELRALVEERDQRNAQRARDKEAQRQLEQEEQERAELARLLAKHGVPPC